MAADKSTPEERAAKANVERADEQIAEALEIITIKTPGELRIDEKAHLQARASYLSGDEKKKFKDVLKEELPRPESKKLALPQLPSHIVTVEQAEAQLAEAKAAEKDAKKADKKKSKKDS